MKRSGAPPRHTPLARGARSLERGRGLRPVGTRAKRSRSARERFKRLVRERAGERCERCGSVYKVEAHHFLPTGRDGPDDPANGVALCGGPDGCHIRVHRHQAPDWRAWISNKENKVAPWARVALGMERWRAA